MSENLTLRRATPADLEPLASICFNAFGAINARHGFPSDFPVQDIAAGMFGFILNAPHVYGVVAEKNGRILGSNFLWGGTIAGVGPITVVPDAQGGVGRMLMEDVLRHAREQNHPGVRLVQAAFNTTSMSLYTKLGFDVREPLVCINGTPLNEQLPGYHVRPATTEDAGACNDLCRRVHGHDRAGEVQGAIAQGTATVVVSSPSGAGGGSATGTIVGYTTGVGFMSHTVALENGGLKALIAAAPQFAGPGFLLPTRNGEVFRWCLAQKLKVVQPLTLMSLGLYNEPRGAFLPSILF